MIKKDIYIEEVICYGNDVVQYNQEEIDSLIEQEFDYITFSSSSTVDNFISIMGKSYLKETEHQILSIGPVTSSTLEKHGVHNYQEAATHNIDGVIDLMK